MIEHINDRSHGENAVSHYLHLLEDESTSGAIQILLNALFVWSRTCYRLSLDSSDALHSSSIDRQARQMVYDGLDKVGYFSREERRPYRKPHPPSADRLNRLIHHIADYAVGLSVEEAVTFFVTLISQWVNTCSAESVFEHVQVSGTPINSPTSNEELTKAVRRSLDLYISDYESLDAIR